MLNETLTIPEYKFSDKIDYTRPIPPYLLYEEENNSPKKRVNHLKNLAQTCAKYSQEFEIIIDSIPMSFLNTSLLNTSPRENVQEELNYSEYRIKRKDTLLSDQERELEMRPSLKRKKKSKELKKLSKKSNKNSEMTFNEEENLETNRGKLEKSQIRPLLNNTNSSFNNSSLPLIQNKVVNEKKVQRFKPYEKQKLPNIETNLWKDKEHLVKTNSQNRTCPWLVNGKICGMQFTADDLFNDHIKNHTTESIFTDLNFYYKAKTLLNPKGFREVC